MENFSIETQLTLAVLGTVSLGSLILLQMQAIKQFFPSVEGQLANRLTLVCALVAVVVACYKFGVDWQAPETYASIYFATAGAYVSAVAQYAFLFKRSVKGLPPPPDSAAPASAFTQQENASEEELSLYTDAVKPSVAEQEAIRRRIV